MAAPERESDVAAGDGTESSVEHAFDALSAASPEGWRVELIEGEIHVVPPANGEHEEIVSEVSDQVTERRRDRELRTYTGLGLFVPDASSTGKVVPDLVIAPKGSFGDEAEYHDPAPVMLVGEVTSRSTAQQDRGPKLRGYARAGVPCYLLIDREAGEVVVFSEPAGDSYTRRAEAKLSKTIELPEPLGFELDTGQF
ncbi:Uma2 family endonuclease [Streptomyces bathyalis]|uniref:Uma2 family endonuclease n=1 Tax=Streptomyces bathyalis TaxID=2710756 RepID=A0A7T1TCP7_9ACTN|nr:Uma2 family endonuclease [Streptomyces bathyalis]QPP10559.1 Uma2 family endonuclease [Streptomyces bathyalis]